VLYLRDTCEQVRVKIRSVCIEDIDWERHRSRFVDLDNQPIEHCFKLYPWEWPGHEEFAPHLATDCVRFIEPTWEMLLSNKGLLPILWELFPDHPNLLPAHDLAALVGRKFDRHEYNLTSDNGDTALLIRGSAPGAKDCVLYTPLLPAEPLTPQQAGAVRFGQQVSVDGGVAKVSAPFQSTTRQVDAPESDAPNNGNVLYCFAGTGGFVPLFARWNASHIDFFRGEALPEKDVIAAFKPPPR
jgi:hypothetical protein